MHSSLIVFSYIYLNIQAQIQDTDIEAQHAMLHQVTLYKETGTMYAIVINILHLSTLYYNVQ